MLFKTTFVRMFNVEDDDVKQQRIDAIARIMNLDPIDATCIAEALQAGVRDAVAAIGASLDTLTPRLQADALPLMMDKFAVESSTLSNMVIASVFGINGPNPGCDCASCQQKKILNEGLNSLEKVVARADVSQT